MFNFKIAGGTIAWGLLAIALGTASPITIPGSLATGWYLLNRAAANAVEKDRFQKEWR